MVEVVDACEGKDDGEIMRGKQIMCEISNDLIDVKCEPLL
jgi:hypothetical protein